MEIIDHDKHMIYRGKSVCSFCGKKLTKKKIKELLRATIGQVEVELVKLDKPNKWGQTEIYYQIQRTVSCKNEPVMNEHVRKKKQKIKRETAKRILKEFLKRVNKVNDDWYFLYQVDKVWLYGSYLTNPESEYVGDIDLDIKISRKKGYQDLDEREYLDEMYDRFFTDKPNSHPSFFEIISYGELEVQKYLKNKSKAISLNGGLAKDYEHCVPHKVIYERKEK